MKNKALAFLIGLQILGTQAFATLEDRMETFRKETPSGFVLTQAHLDAMNGFVGEDVFAFLSGRQVNHTLYNNTLSRTFANALTPADIARAASFGEPSRFRYVLLPYAPIKSDVFMASCASLIQDFVRHSVFDEALLTRVCTLPEERLEAMASAHFPPFLLPAVLDSGAHIEHVRLPQLGRFFSSFLEGEEPYLITPRVLWIMERFQDMSPNHAQCVIEAPLGPSSFNARCALLAHVSSFSLDVLPLIPRLFATHRDLEDLFFHLKHENPSFEKLSHITQLPPYLQARYFVSGVTLPTPEEEVLLLALFKDMDEDAVSGALTQMRPSSQELSRLDALGLPPPVRVAALYAKDFLPLENPDPERLALFLSLMEGLTPLDAKLVATRDLGPHLDIKRLHDFNALCLPSHVRYGFSHLFLGGHLDASKVPAILGLMGLYSQEDQCALAKDHAYSLTQLSHKHLDELTQAAFPIDILKNVIGYKSISSGAIDFIKKMTSFFEKPDYPYTIDDVFSLIREEELPGYHEDLDQKIAQSLTQRDSSSSGREFSK